MLAVAASSAPSATETLKKTAPVVAAKQAGNVEAKAAIDKTFEGAKAGNPEDIKKMGNVVAVQTIDDINKGKPVSPAMTDAINIHERAAAGDPAAIETLKTINAEATKPNPAPEATAAAIAAGAAAVTVAALASKPKAKAEFMEKVNPPMNAADKGPAEAEAEGILAKAKAGTVTPEEGERGVRLAERLGKPALAAQISSMSPPMPRTNPLSSLPDRPLAPITGLWDLVKESLKAIAFATPDPLANYRGGIASRSREPATAEPISSSGWSPFAYFRNVAPWVAPIASTTAAAASISNLISNKQHKAAPAPAPAPAAAPAPAPAPAQAPAMAPAPIQTVTQSPSEAALTAEPATASQGTVSAKNSASQDELFALLNKRADGSFTEADRQKALGLARAMNLPLVTAKLEATKPTTSTGDTANDDPIPSDLLNDPVVRDNVKIIAWSWNRDAKNAAKGEEFYKKQFAKKINELKQQVDEHHKGDNSHMYPYWTARMAAPMSPPLRSFFARVEPSLKIQANDAELSKPYESNAYGKAGVDTVYINELPATKSSGEAPDAGILPPDEKLTRKQIVQHALNNKTMSRDDFNKVAAGNPDNAKKLLAFLKSKQVTISGTFVGEDKKTFKQLIAAALKSKKMSKADFNAAMEDHLGKKATPESKAASGDKVLSFLTTKGVKVEK